MDNSSFTNNDSNFNKIKKFGRKVMINQHNINTSSIISKSKENIAQFPVLVSSSPMNGRID